MTEDDDDDDDDGDNDDDDDDDNGDDDWLTLSSPHMARVGGSEAGVWSLRGWGF